MLFSDEGAARKIGSLGVAALGCDPLKDGDVLVVEADWKKCCATDGTTI